jgi:hypothetical protein
VYQIHDPVAAGPASYRSVIERLEAVTSGLLHGLFGGPSLELVTRSEPVPDASIGIS